MGVYMYKVTGKKVKLSNGETANIAKFAYKPYFWGADADKNNSRMHYRSGCYYADRRANEGKLSNWVVFEGAEHPVKFNRPVGSFQDGCITDDKCVDVMWDK